MTTCPACGDRSDGRFCGTCGALLRPRREPPGRHSAVAAPASHGAGTGVELPSGRPRPWRTLTIGLLVLALGAAAVLTLRPRPEVVSADRWRGDGTGRTSTRAAAPDVVLWSIGRVGSNPADDFRLDQHVPVAVTRDRVIAAVNGTLLGLDTATGRIDWEREVGWAQPRMLAGRLVVPRGPGLVLIDPDTGEDQAYVGTGRDQPVAVLAGTTDATVVLRAGPRDGTTLVAYGPDGTSLWSAADLLGERDVESVPVALDGDPDSGSLLLGDANGQRLLRVDIASGRVSVAVDGWRGGWTRSTTGGWALGLPRDTDGDVTVARLDGAGRTFTVPSSVLRDADAIHAIEDGAVVFGQSPRFRRPPDGNSAAVVIDVRSGTLTPVRLSAGFGTVIGSRPGGVLTSSGSLVRLVEVTAAGATSRWQQGIDPGFPVTLVGDHLVQMTSQRWRVWDADTGATIADVEPRGLPLPDRRPDSARQPYVRPDGFVLDATETLTQVIDPITGNRVDVRGSVHLASTPFGDLARRGRAVSLLETGDDAAWILEVDGLDAVAAGDRWLVTAGTDGGVVVRVFDLRDGAPVGAPFRPDADAADDDPDTGWVSDVVVLGPDSFLVVGSSATRIDVTADGPVVRWHVPVTLDPTSTTVVLGDQAAFVGQGAVVRIDLATGAITTVNALPAHIHPVVAVDGRTAIATSGHDVLALDLDSLEVRWRTTLESRLTSAPTLAGGQVYVGTEAGNLVILDRDGRVRATFDTGFEQPVVGAPTVANGLVLLHADRGRRLIALGRR